MGNKTNRTVQADSKLEDKFDAISRKVWERTKKEPQIINVNDDGSVPVNVGRRVQRGQVIMTNHIDGTTGDRMALTKVGHTLLKIQIKEV